MDDETFESCHPQPLSAMLRHTINLLLNYLLVSAQSTGSDLSDQHISDQLRRVWVKFLDQLVLDQLISKHAQDCSTGERLRLIRSTWESLSKFSQT